MAKYYLNELEGMKDVDTQDLGYRHFRIAELMYYLGQYESSKVITERGYNLLEKNYFYTSEMAYIINLYARLYDQSGNNDEALKYYQDALKIRTKLFGKTHLLVANSINNVAVFYQKVKAPSLSYPLFIECIDILKDLYGEVHAEIADVLNNMALVLYDENKTSEALEMNLKSVDIRKVVQGEYHPKIAASYTNIGNIYKNNNEYESAKMYYDMAHKINIKVYGEIHPTIANDYINYGAWTINTEEARVFFTKAYGIKKICLGPEHEETLSAFNYIGNPSKAKSMSVSIVHRKCF